MSDTATVISTAAATRGRPKTAKPRKKKATANHPKYMEMSISAINEMNDRNGLSRQAILKYIIENYEVSKDAKAVNTHLKIALKRGLSTGVLKHAKGQGASGSFRISDKVGPVMRKPRRKSLKRNAPPPPAEKVKIEKVELPKKKIVKKKKAAIVKSTKKVVEKKKTVTAKAKKAKSSKKPALKKSAGRPRKLKSSKRGKK
uniref:H15 domain-containing protein n=1 Tax=Strigamia maritima TaxID=126957 RepID=T1ITR2_STRMM